MPRNVIVLKASRLSDMYVEGRALGALKPGYLIMRDPATNKLTPHATAGGGGLANPECIVAVEDSLQGKTINDAYAANDLVRGFIPQPGDELQLVLKGAQNLANNGPLTSNGDGTFKVATGTDNVLFRGLEALDLTALGDGFCVGRRV